MQENNNEVKYKAMKYIRLSDADGNDAESNSVGNQRKLIDEFLKSHPEIEVIGEKIDDGFTGILFDRPAFQEMMTEIEAGNVNCCITKDLSRFGREYIETGRYLRRILPAYGVRFIAINDNIDTLKDRADDLTVSLKSIINDAYSRDISIKTRSALEAKRKDGDYIGSCPVYGYIRDEFNHNRLVIDEYAANIVQDIFRMKLDGHSSMRIADTLNERGVLSPIEYKKDRGLPHARGGYSDKDGAKWSATTVIRILNDEIYTGSLIQGKCTTPNYKLKARVKKPKDEWQITENAHEAIISRYVYNLAQKILRLDTRTSPNSDKVYLFSGILVCGCCGNRMKRKTVPYKGTKYFYYACSTGKKNGCNGSMVKENDLIECVLEIIKSHVTNIAELESLLQTLDSDTISRELVKNLTTQVAENQLRLEKNKEFKTGLYESFINGNLSKTEYKTLKDRYTADSEVLSKANEKLKKEVEDVLSCSHERLKWTRVFKEFENLDTLDRKTVIHLLHSIRIMGKTDIEIAFNYQIEYEAALKALREGAAA